MGWIKEALGAARTIRALRKSGETCKLALVDESELMDNRQWLAIRDKENKLMQELIMNLHSGRNVCKYCEEYKGGCNKADTTYGLGCGDWWLRFLTEEELEECAKRAGFTTPEVNSEADDKHGDEPDSNHLEATDG